MSNSTAKIEWKFQNPPEFMAQELNYRQQVVMLCCTNVSLCAEVQLSHGSSDGCTQLSDIKQGLSKEEGNFLIS
jgi:hypothetical protein